MQLEFGFLEELKPSNCAKCQRNSELKIDGIHGKYSNGVVFVFDFPSKKEVESGEVFSCGYDNISLRNQSMEHNFRYDYCNYTYAVCCAGKKPTDQQIKCCADRLYEDLKKANPKLVVFVGYTAFKSYLYLKWKKDLRKPERWMNQCYLDSDLNCMIYPIFSPSELRNNMSDVYRKTVYPLISYNQIEEIKSLAEQQIPNIKTLNDYIKEVKIVSPEESILYLNNEENNYITAFDFETTGLYPFGKDQRIYSCSISNHVGTYSFLVDDVNKEALKNYISNPNTKKIMANMAFEAMWSKDCLGVEIKGNVYDICMMNHFLDNRGGISSLKFLTFKHLGIPDYDSGINDYLKSDDVFGLNKVTQAPVDDILIYNGLDALFTRLVGMKLSNQVYKLRK